MAVNLWPERVTWPDLPIAHRRKVMIHLGRLIRRCLADPQQTGSREAADDQLTAATRTRSAPITVIGWRSFIFGNQRPSRLNTIRSWLVCSMPWLIMQWSWAGLGSAFW